MHKTDLNCSELAGRNPAGDNIPQAHTPSPGAGSCLPSPLYSIRSMGGTALFALEGLIRKQLEASARGILPLNDTGKRLCSMPQAHEIDLLAVTRGHRAK